MRETFIPLFTSTIRSSLWSLSGDCLKVFLTLALEADPEGYVSASVDGIRRIVDLPLEDVQRHLDTLSSPDPHSKDITRNQGADGRRIEKVANGWKVLNLEWYRELARRESEKARKRAWWNEAGTTARRGARRTDTETINLTTLDIGATSKGKARRGTLSHFVPEQWAPTETHRAKVRGRRPDSWFDVQVGKFKNHEFKVAKSDWNRAFHNWLDTALENPYTQSKPARREEDDAGYA